MTNDITCSISTSSKVLIKANAANVDLNEPLYAINWFSTKVEWLYHLYNFMAAKSLAKVGGRAFFKAKITKTVLDEKNVARDLILIVRYPGGQSFKALLQTTYFKIVSILRIMAVKDFSFGFTQQRILNDASSVNDGLCYAVHHFKSSKTGDSLFSKFNDLLGDKVRVKYAGAMVAQLFSQQNSDPPKQVPNLMDGLVLFESDTELEISRMLDSPAYKSLIQELESSYIGHIKRTL